MNNDKGIDLHPNNKLPDLRGKDANFPFTYTLYLRNQSDCNSCTTFALFASYAYFHHEREQKIIKKTRYISHKQSSSDFHFSRQNRHHGRCLCKTQTLTAYKDH